MGMLLPFDSLGCAFAAGRHGHSACGHGSLARMRGRQHSLGHGLYLLWAWWAQLLRLGERRDLRTNKQMEKPLHLTPVSFLLLAFLPLSKRTSLPLSALCLPPLLSFLPWDFLLTIQSMSLYLLMTEEGRKRRSLACCTQPVWPYSPPSLLSPALMQCVALLL